MIVVTGAAGFIGSCLVGFISGFRWTDVAKVLLGLGHYAMHGCVQLNVSLKIEEYTTVQW